MLSKEVTDKDGNKKTVMAESEAELSKMAKAIESQEKPTYPNINHPVAKGHDLVENQPDGSVKLVDGTGAHNSPNDAVRPFSTETDGDVPVAGMDEPEYKSQGDPANVRPTEADAKKEDKTEAKK